jgi:hypothetical protein
MGRTISRKAGRVSRRGETDAAADLRCDRVHKARREILPPSDEFLDAPIDPRLVAWVTKWEQIRIRWMESLENVIEEFPLAETVNSLEWMVREMNTYFEVSAKKYRLEMEAILDEA